MQNFAPVLEALDYELKIQLWTQRRSILMKLMPIAKPLTPIILVASLAQRTFFHWIHISCQILK